MKKKDDTAYIDDLIDVSNIENSEGVKLRKSM